MKGFIANTTTEIEVELIPTRYKNWWVISKDKEVFTAHADKHVIECIPNENCSYWEYFQLDEERRIRTTHNTWMTQTNEGIIQTDEPCPESLKFVRAIIEHDPELEESKTEESVPEPKPKRKPNPFALFGKAHREEVKRNNPGISLGESQKILGSMWRSLTDEEKLKYST